MTDRSPSVRTNASWSGSVMCAASSASSTSRTTWETPVRATRDRAARRVRVEREALLVVAAERLHGRIGVGVGHRDQAAVLVEHADRRTSPPPRARRCRPRCAASPRSPARSRGWRPARDRRSARARADRSASSASRWRSSRRRRSVLSITTALTPEQLAVGRVHGPEGADPVAQLVRRGRGAGALISRSSTGRPLRTTVRWASATRSPAAPSTSPTVRPEVLLDGAPVHGRQRGVHAHVALARGRGRRGRPARWRTSCPAARASGSPRRAAGRCRWPARSARRASPRRPGRRPCSGARAASRAA